MSSEPCNVTVDNNNISDYVCVGVDADAPALWVLASCRLLMG